MLGLPEAVALPSESDLGREYFERHIRPILVARCLDCHSGAKPKSGLSLEHRKGWVRGGSRGRAIRPGQPDRSLLIQVLRGEDDKLRMPPEGEPLTVDEIASLVEWIRLGAYDPRKPSQSFQRPSESAHEAGKHWAFQAIKRPSLPANRLLGWENTAIDHFVLKGLEGSGISPSEEASPRTAVRRIFHDLIGLPPSVGEISRYLADQSPGAWRRLVDGLLEDPRYGERWGRHWLDVARYADTTGYRAVGKQRRFPYSYTYRDYVVQSFNAGLPFDRFIREQLAADQLPGENREHLAAMGFLTVGRTFLDDQTLVIDDRIDVVTRGLMGLTVQCSRCHDHKYDPIPTADYYSLYGVFASSEVPKELPLLGRTSVPGLSAAYLAEKKRREHAFTERFAEEVEIAHHRIRKAAGSYLLGVHLIAQSRTGRERQRFQQERKLVPVVFRQLEEYRKLPIEQQHDILRPWADFSTRGSSNWGALNRSYRATKNSAIGDLFRAGPVVSLADLADRYNRLFAACDTAKIQEDPAWEKVRQFIRAPESPFVAPESEHWTLVQLVREPLNALRARIVELDGEHPGAPARAMVLRDKKRPQEPVIFERGNPSLRGERVPRQFLALTSRGKRKPFVNGSGRLEMAEAIVDPQNPLTARVFVNRLWMHHFGTPMVSSPSDFGVRAGKPSHPKLLDWLAAEFINSGWSIKHMHRLILNSATYRQASDDRAGPVAGDPANRLYWKMNRRRLELEPMRDTMLYVAGQLDQRQGGLAEELFTGPFNHRRTIYGIIDRARLPAFLRSFDLASPDVSTEKRVETSVPQQALFLMNSPFVRSLAGEVTVSPEFRAIERSDDRIRFLYRSLFQRTPSVEEFADGRSFVGDGQLGESYAGPIGWQYGIGNLKADGRVGGFGSFDRFTDEAWQMGEIYPGDDLGHARIWNDGGHPSSRPDRDVIRRWTAPATGVVRIHGQVSQRERGSDGVKAYVVSSRSGILGQWLVRQSAAQTVFRGLEVELGESIDFLCDSAGSDENDSFTWIPVVEYTAITARSGQGEVRRVWRAKADFKKSFAPIPPSQTKWEQYVQVLLQANELHFID